MKKIHILSIAWALTLASCSLQTRTEDFFGSVRGSVRCPSDCPATVTLSCIDDSEVLTRTAAVEEDGTFFFDRVENGLYRVTALCERSAEKSLSVTVNVSSSEVTVESFLFTELTGGGNGESGEELSLPSDFELTVTKDASVAVSRAVTVMVVCGTRQRIVRLCYSAGLHGKTFFESGYGTSLNCLSHSASVQLNQNGQYTFYAKAEDGSVSMATLELSCIDTDAPEPVSDVRAAFSTQSGKLEVQWENSLSDDVHSVEVTCSGITGEQKQTVSAAKNSCAFDCIPDNSQYTVKVCAVDVAGNRSRGVTQTVIASIEPAVYRAWLDRSRVACGDGTKQMVLFVQGCNFGQAKEGLFVVQLDSYDTVPHPFEVKDATSAQCSFVIPQKKGNYVARIIYDDTVLAQTVFEVCDAPCIKELSLDKTQVASGSSHTVTATVSGKDLDLCTSVVITLSAKNKTPVEKTLSPVSASCWQCVFESPAEEADYSVSVSVDGVVQQQTCTLQVYGDITVSAIDEAFAPLCNCGKEIELIVRGKNLNVAENAVTVSCNGKMYVPYRIEPTVCYVRVTVPVSSCARDIPVTVSINGTECDIKGVLKVQELRDYVDSQFALIQIAAKAVTVSKAGSGLLKANTQLSAFSLGRYPVTQGLWYTVYEWACAHGYSFGKTYAFENISSLVPCTGVSWREAVVWCNAFTEWHNAHLKQGEQAFSCVYYEDIVCTKVLRTVCPDSALMTDSGKNDNPVVKKNANGYRLPSSAEWEYAFRGADGNATDWNYVYAGSSCVSEVCWCASTSGSVLHECGIKNANRLGLYDMSGTVWEWISDWAYTNVTRRLRGGSYKSTEEECSASNEGLAKIPYYSDGTWGFRVARGK